MSRYNYRIIYTNSAGFTFKRTKILHDLLEKLSSITIGWCFLIGAVRPHHISNHEYWDSLPLYKH